MVVMMSSGFTWKLGNLLENFKNVFQWISLYHFSNIFSRFIKEMEHEVQLAMQLNQ